MQNKTLVLLLRKKESPSALDTVEILSEPAKWESSDGIELNQQERYEGGVRQGRMKSRQNGRLPGDYDAGGRGLGRVIRWWE